MYRKIKDYFRLFLYNTFLFLFLITPKILMKYILKFFAFFAFRFNKKHIKIPQYILEQYSKRSGVSKNNILEYLKKIDYTLGIKEKRALKLFLKLTKEKGLK